ncbi:MAG TPA: hypothetical protein PKE06_04460 [Flavilitoribacter sp.]|nr:hypothetical protein [Flavilitoribacter sp.]HMQ86113.1 hypothetical protein [Flavilitoribacter sp.]
MAARKFTVGSLLKSILILLVVVQVFRACSIPVTQGFSLETATTIDLGQLLNNIDAYAGVPVRIKQAIAEKPSYFYFGGLYYIRSKNEGEKIMVWCRDFPPKEGAEITLFGQIQPVLFWKNMRFAYFRQINWKPIADDDVRLTTSVN